MDYTLEQLAKYMNKRDLGEIDIIEDSEIFEYVEEVLDENKYLLDLDK